MAFVRALKECHVRKYLSSSIEDHQQVLVTQVMKRDPLLQHPVLGQVISAKLIKLFVIEIRLTANPEVGDFDCNHVVALARKEQKIAPVCAGKPYPPIPVAHPALHL